MTTRGSSVRLHRSLRARILASSGLAFFGLAILVAFLLPRVFENQLKTDLRRRTMTSAESLAAYLAEARIDEDATVEGGILRSARGWLETQPDLESALVVNEEGEIVGSWPADCPRWYEGRIDDARALESSSYFVSTADVPRADDTKLGVAVRASTANLIQDLESVRWLFASIILLGGAAYFVLTKYLTSAILQPLEDIRQVARSLADGEPTVKFPSLADDEIAELGGFLRTLGDSRRHSRILRRPEFQARLTEDAARREAEGAVEPDPESGPTRES